MDPVTKLKFGAKDLDKITQMAQTELNLWESNFVQTESLNS